MHNFDNILFKKYCTQTKKKNTLAPLFPLQSAYLKVSSKNVSLLSVLSISFPKYVSNTILTFLFY